MKITPCFLLLLMLLFADAANARDSLESHIPENNAPEFLFNNLDIASFRSSLGPRRTRDDRTFSSLLSPPTTVTADSIEILEDDWVWRLTIVDRGDFNGDGVEDLAVCFDDRAIGSAYHSNGLLLVTRYDDSSLAVALNYSVSTSKARDNCRETPEG